ncbi:hypothetical protein [Pararcticibacter amylolyticus]|uniref:DUF4249 domain-containing protein n=1 Tax=Pararcticibacter amylolyticus TaxID=2173175 RepID=A0A2U2PGD8_9SPHI|nr:hypothetical protein [Pararcticibacter amylolyticus]PWG80322.1 hypothetical protein DDR33_11960 [Pararcticibacter amylolyticus]
MKVLKKYIRTTLLSVLLISTLSACNKEDQDVEKAMHIIVSGYNAGDSPLMISIDTTRYNRTNDIVKPTSLIGLNAVYTYTTQKERLLTITDTVTQKVLYSKALPVSGSKANFNFVYLDGHELEIQTPTADPATNKLSFYIQYTADDSPFDIFLYRMDNDTGTEHRQYLARNVKSRTWINLNYVPDEYFSDYNAVRAGSICFTKTGTTDQWAFNQDENMSKLDASGLILPKAGEKGLVLPYFVVHDATSKLTYTRLFFYPDRS